MVRKKKPLEEKKIELSVAVDSCYLKRLNKLKANKSKFIGWLLLDYLSGEGVEL